VAGYSGTPLAKKLGIKDGHVVALIDAPDHAAELLDPLPDAVELRHSARGAADVSVVFCADRRAFERRLSQLWARAFPDRAVWIAWPKKSSDAFIDLTEDHVRETVLPLGLVDVKVCAIDATWSGLKIVVRKELRGT
jgi:hypothetical protein